MVTIIGSFVVIFSGIWIIYGTYKKKKWLVDPEKSKSSVFEYSQYIGKQIVGKEMLVIGNYIGGIMAVIAGLLVIIFSF